jgi:competence protein ComEC
LAGLVVAYLSPQPDLLIGRDGATVALRVSDGSLKLLQPAKDAYSADEWLKRDGDTRISADAVAAASDGVLCDPYGCLAQARVSVTVADVLRPEALAEDCADAAIVISKAPVRNSCAGPILALDSAAIARANGFAIWLGPPIRWQSVEQFRGHRPWSALERPRRAQYRRISPTSLP